MIKLRLYCIGLLGLAALHSPAQTSTSAQQQMEKAKKRIAEDKDMDAAQKAMLLQMMDSKGVKNATQWTDQHPGEVARLRQVEEGKASLPPRDAHRIAAIPATPVTAVQVKHYVSNLSGMLSSAMDAEARKHADSLLQSLKDSGDRMSATAVGEWLAGDPGGAAYIAAKAASVLPSPVCLGNLGGMLNMLSKEEKAIPVLQYALKQAPKDAVLLNNMGRAWLGLGETVKAKQLFLACIWEEPFHPEANNSLGCIYEAEKNVKEAISCFEHSLQGAYNDNAADRLSKLEPQADVPALISHHFTPPRYFDEFRIQLPDECRDILQTEQVRKLHDAFEWGLGDLIGQYAAEEKMEQEKANREMAAFQQRVLQNLQTGRPMSPTLPPFGKLAARMMVRLNEYYASEKLSARKDYDSAWHLLTADFKRAALGVQEKYNKLKAACKFEGEGGVNEEAKYERLGREECDALLALCNEYQDHAATLHETFVNRFRPLLLNYFNSRVYWGNFLTPHSSFNNLTFYVTIEDLLREMSDLSASAPYISAEYLCQRPGAAGPVARDKYTADKKPYCPVSFKVGFGIGSLSISCISFSVSGGEGIKLGYKYNFSNQQTTLSVGAGLSAEFGIGATAGASSGESLYVTFDGNGQPSDVGFKFDAGITGKIGSFKVDESGGYTMGLNSGWNFSAPSGSATMSLN